MSLVAAWAAGGRHMDQRRRIARQIIGGAAGMAALAIAWGQLGRTDRRIPRLEALPRPSATCPTLRIVVIIPARDEAATIERCVWSLATQSLAPTAIIVVDDQSTDATADRVRALQADLPTLRLIAAPARPDGWSGKPWALHQGALAALATDAEWILLTDADTWHAPSLLARAWQVLLQTRCDVLTVLPGVTEPSVGATLVRGAVGEWYSFFYGANYALRTTEARATAAMAAGQFILARAEIVRTLHGFDHPTLRDALDDDRAFVAAAKRAGFRVALARAPQLLTTAGYANFAAAWQGHAHHITATVSTPRQRLRAIGAALALGGTTCMPLITLFAALRHARSRGVRTSALPLASASMQLAGTLAVRQRAARLAHLPGWYALVGPLNAVLAPLLVLRAIARRHILWKGRVYQR
jgi:GT2 family glycosyltransferase